MDTTSSGLRLRPDAVPRLRQAYLDALAELASVPADGFRVEQPAMADDASLRFLAALNSFAADGPGSVAAQVTAFERRLRASLATLGDIQRAYDRNETDTAAMLSRQLEP